MPKLKTKSSAKKRFKLTASGKVKRKCAFMNHILTKKTHKQKKRLSKMQVVHSADEANIKEMMRV